MICFYRELLDQLKEANSMETKAPIIEKIVCQMSREFAPILDRVGTPRWVSGWDHVSSELMEKVNYLINYKFRFLLSASDVKSIKIACWCAFSGRWSRVLHDMYPVPEEVAKIARRDHQILFTGLNS